MPCLDISTNVNLDGLDTDSISSDLAKAVSLLVGKPEKFVMILLKGSISTLTFGGSKEPAALAEITSMGGINSDVKRKLIATIGSILQTKLCIPKTRFVLKVFDTTIATKLSKL